MKPRPIINAAAAVTAFVAIVLAGMSFSSPHVQAQVDIPDSIQTKVAIGLAIAPVHLSYDTFDKNQTTLVGLGSYIVNAQADCNGCHNSPDLGGEFVEPTGDPFLLSPPKIQTKVNPAGYLGGGSDFGPVAGPPSPDIVARNLTPDITGLPEGGHTLQQFKIIMRTGKDYDHLHPTCGPAGPDGTCLPAPINGSVLQIMPWTTFGNMTDYDLEAVYTYLGAIPCISHKNTPGLPANIYQNCPGGK